MTFWLKVYGGAFAAFLALDLLWLGVVAKGFHHRQIGFLMADSPNWTAALLFYLLFVAGILVFVIQPGLAAGTLKSTILRGAFFGVVTYAAFDLTRQAVLKNWPVALTEVDLCWGMILTGSASAVGHLFGSRVAWGKDWFPGCRGGGGIPFMTKPTAVVRPAFRLAVWGGRLRRELDVWILVSRHPGTPRAPRLVLILTLAYAASPIDLVPDVIPVLGHLDDLLLVPLGLWLASRMVPPWVLVECRARAGAGEPTLARGGRWVAAGVVLLWLLAIILLARRWVRAGT
ncbi:MAG: DUF2177 family protein [bacterium]|jgi:uncharacterized membrane protein/uncharacterized membrane protein YkvA (DUF1232 family)|nr:DUF2177 family protein [bacterium]